MTQYYIIEKLLKIKSLSKIKIQKQFTIHSTKANASRKQTNTI